MLKLSKASPRQVQHVYGVLARVKSTDAAAATLEASLETPKGWDTAKPFDSLPGPKPLPIIGNAWRFLPIIGEYANMEMSVVHKKFINEYGKILKFGGVPGRKDMVMLYDAEDASQVYRNEGVWPIRGGLESFSYYRNVTRKDFFQGAGGTLATQGEAWGKFRSTVNQPMMQPRVAKVYVGPIDAVADDFIKKFSELRDPTTGEMPDYFVNELYKWALESVVMIALDTRLGCLDGNLRKDSEAQAMIDNVQIIFDSFFQLDFKLSFWKVVSTPAWRRFVKSMDFFTEICMKYINKSLERSKTLPEGHEPSVLERILARDSNPKVAATMAIDMMTAGIDTTSHAVAFLLYHLATNPDVQAKLQEEIDSLVPRNSTVALTAENLDAMKYLKACIKESMRITPVAVANLRTSTKDMVLQGYRIPKDTDIIMGHMTMSMLEENFPQPEKFIPERWMKEDSDAPLSHKNTHPFVFLPFGFGPRSCVGRRFAELEIEILVVKILRSFNIEWNHPPMQTESKVLNLCKSPLKFKMIDRK